MDANNNSMDSISNENIPSPQELEQLNRVRLQFLEKVAKDPERFYPQDIDLVKADDWWTLRFIKWNRGNEDKALKQMVSAFKWRKSFGLHDRKRQ
ncbi:Motile sperm domain-containing protein 2 [Tyrophagus putrescentiae]|nr:Motile sperm domain-containing protein 2 [Tyrophagus putrescentiae]